MKQISNAIRRCARSRYQVAAIFDPSIEKEMSGREGEVGRVEEVFNIAGETDTEGHVEDVGQEAGLADHSERSRGKNSKSRIRLRGNGGQANEWMVGVGTGRDESEFNNTDGGSSITWHGELKIRGQS